MVGVAQLVEHWVVAPVVAGSSPVTHPIKNLAPLLPGRRPYRLEAASMERGNGRVELNDKCLFIFKL